ncbi:envelope stress response membrane protein PspB [Sphingomonas lenta]|uniref:Envelope stress response membrane protein PspB n=1 Tax=Sphingomonas lenta TaxID=1141887 RepID=A0A2A2SKT2_9SPHN|nr:envelope stress response membrane protein PspB [Sphingomonas lenta]PAX09621.1 envelope stress response membrane protein PspB [Sphingomonas lenta]
MEDVFLPIVIVGILFVGLPWVILHYVTKWKQAPRITDEDERLLDEMYTLARRLEERLNTVERIVAADNPDFKAGITGPTPEWKPSLNAPQSQYQLDRRN